MILYELIFYWSCPLFGTFIRLQLPTPTSTVYYWWGRWIRWISRWVGRINTDPSFLQLLVRAPHPNVDLETDRNSSSPFWSSSTWSCPSLGYLSSTRGQFWRPGLRSYHGRGWWRRPTSEHHLQEIIHWFSESCPGPEGEARRWGENDIRNAWCQ